MTYILMKMVFLLLSVYDRVVQAAIRSIISSKILIHFTLPESLLKTNLKPIRTYCVEFLLCKAAQPILQLASFFRIFTCSQRFALRGI